MAQKNSHAARKKGGVWKILLVLVVLLALAVGGALLFAHNEISGNGRPGAEVTVSIPQGSGVSAIAQKLKDAGVIRSAYLFRWYVGQKGAAAKLQYGDFTLQKSACSYDAIIAALSTYAKAETVRVTIPEGTTAIAIAQKMEAAGLCSAEDFLKEANEGDFSEYTFWQYVPDDAARAMDSPPFSLRPSANLATASARPMPRQPQYASLIVLTSHQAVRPVFLKSESATTRASSAGSDLMQSKAVRSNEVTRTPPTLTHSASSSSGTQCRTI